jgi:hypothetical protein
MEYYCEKCDKIYSSYQSLWIHNKKFHSMNNNQKVTIESSQSNPKVTIESSQSNLKCKYCNKIFKFKQGKWRHEQKCENKNDIKINNEIKFELVEIKNKIIKLENKKNNKITNNIKVNGNIFNDNKMDVGPKIIINKTGSENINQITYDEVSTIFDNEISSVVKLIELVNFNENKPENHSFCSTALESPYLSFYNTDTNTVNKERKRYFFEEVICKSIQNHEILYSKFKNKFNSIKRKQIEDNIYNLKKIKENSFNSKIIGEMIRNLNLLSYNNRDIVQETWTGRKYEHESDEEFMAMLLDDPETQKILKAEAEAKVNKYDNNSDSSDSDDRPKLLFNRDKFKKKEIEL